MHEYHPISRNRICFWNFQRSHGPWDVRHRIRWQPHGMLYITGRSCKSFNLLVWRNAILLIKSIINEKLVDLGLSPLPVTVTTRIFTFLLGYPYKPSFATIARRGGQPKVDFMSLFQTFSLSNCFRISAITTTPICLKCLSLDHKAIHTSSLPRYSDKYPANLYFPKLNFTGNVGV